MKDLTISITGSGPKDELIQDLIQIIEELKAETDFDQDITLEGPNLITEISETETGI